MNGIARLPAKDRRQLFVEAGARRGLPPFHVEKDFWVCWVLGVLFGDADAGSHLTFRGGTSLSKAWGIIERFSEDIDISMSRPWLGNSKDPAENGLISAERERRLKALRDDCREAIRSRIHPLLENAAGTLQDVFHLEVEPLDKARDPFCLHFHYPTTQLAAPSDYNRPAVKVELSGRAEGWPMEPRTIRPYVAEEFPNVAGPCELMLSCVHPARTFWEKAALVHEHNSRPEAKPLSPAQARHLYDLNRLWTEAAVAQAGGFRELFTGVKAHRAAFFAYNWVDYSSLIPSTLCLRPRDERLAEWRNDYARMRPMFFSDPPSFDLLVSGLETIEKGLATL
ncbi:MAG: nucleotidyl transferase AbiEii/AbiGii toxin family protein [Verrucomicrobia bacterium]|nr:nucleotidyl transferase AbiEii/AbiGii toxin family protein [Verrucomicrobiota bacterium]